MNTNDELSPYKPKPSGLPQGAKTGRVDGRRGRRIAAPAPPGYAASGTKNNGGSKKRRKTRSKRNKRRRKTRSKRKRNNRKTRSKK